MRILRLLKHAALAALAMLCLAGIARAQYIQIQQSMNGQYGYRKVFTNLAWPTSGTTFPSILLTGLPPNSAITFVLRNTGSNNISNFQVSQIQAYLNPSETFSLIAAGTDATFQPQCQFYTSSLTPNLRYANLIPAISTFAAGASVWVTCPSNQIAGAYQFSLGGATATTTVDMALMVFPQVPPAAATDSSGGQFSGGFTYTPISTNTNTSIKSSAGTLHLITVNSIGSAETITIWDNSTCGSGNEIGPTGSLATIGTLFYDIQFNTGLCIATAGTTAANIVVAWR